MWWTVIFGFILPLAIIFYRKVKSEIEIATHGAARELFALKLHCVSWTNPWRLEIKVHMLQGRFILKAWEIQNQYVFWKYFKLSPVRLQVSELDIAFLMSCKNWALYLIFMNMIIDSIRLSESRFHFYTFEFKSKKQVIHRIESYVLAVKINFDLWVNSILFHLFD